MRSFVVLVLLFTALAVGVLWGQSNRSQAQLRKQVLLLAEQRGLQLADAMAGQVDGLFSAADLALNQLRSAWQQNPPDTFAQTVRDTLETLPAGFVSHAEVADAEGRVVFDSLGLGAGVNIADRDYFRSHQKGGDDLVVGEPVRSKLNGRWVFVVSRPLLLKDRSFAGTVHLTLSTEFLSSKLAALALSEQDVVALIHAGGSVLARSKDNAGSIGQTMPADRPYLAQSDARDGVYRAPGRLDGVPRTYGWHRLPESGAVVVIGLADASVLGPLEPVLHQGQQLTAALSLLILAGGGLIAGLVWRVARGQEALDMSHAAVGASAARLKEAQQLAHVGNWEYDIEDDRLVWSEEVCRLFGMDPAGEPPSRALFRSKVHPDDLEPLMAGYNAALGTHQLFNAVFRIVAADGSTKHVRGLCVNAYDGERPVRSSGTLQDITETRSAQLELQQLNDQLEQRVAARTRELGTLNQELEAFAYSVSHDLRTPLRSIHGYASLLEEDATGLSAQERSHLHRIQESAKRMGQLITDLLTMAQHSRALISYEAVNLSELARGIVKELERESPERRVQWTIEDALVVRADPVLMGVVLQNLLGNAWKYTSQTAQPHIGFTRTRQAGNMAEFCVSDNGAGFDMAYVQQLFQPFKRLHAHHEFEGSGVGLASVQRVVQRHGGTVRAEGAVGQGAAFFFSLPLQPPQAAPGAP